MTSLFRGPSSFSTASEKLALSPRFLIYAHTHTHTHARAQRQLHHMQLSCTRESGGEKWRLTSRKSPDPTFSQSHRALYPAGQTHDSFFPSFLPSYQFRCNDRVYEDENSDPPHLQTIPYIIALMVVEGNRVGGSMGGSGGRRDVQDRGFGAGGMMLRTKEEKGSGRGVGLKVLKEEG